MIKSFALCFLFAGLLFVVACGRQADNTQESYGDVDSTESYETNTPITIPALLVQIKAGDFSSLVTPENGESLLEQLRNIHTRATAENYEWVEFDVNGDGINELILQASDGGKMQRIVAIFTFDFENSETSLVYFHTVELPRFLFLGENGNLIWYHFSYGVFNWNSWNRREFVDGWNMARRDTLRITYIYCYSEMPEDWHENNPDMTEPGVYFHRYSMCYDAVGEILDEYQFVELFEEMMGFSFYYAQPDWWQIDMLEEYFGGWGDWGIIRISPRDEWQIAYTEILRNYLNSPVDEWHTGWRFILHDMDSDNVPELFILGSQTVLSDGIAAYTFRNGAVRTLENADFWLSFYAAPRNAHGMIIISTSEGLADYTPDKRAEFNWWTHIVLDGDRLIGKTTAEIVSWFTQDWESGTHYYINGEQVTEADFNAIIEEFLSGGASELFAPGAFPLEISEENIRDIANWR